MMGFPAGVLQVQRCEYDLNVPQYRYIGMRANRRSFLNQMMANSRKRLVKTF